MLLSLFHGIGECQFGVPASHVNAFLGCTWRSPAALGSRAAYLMRCSIRADALRTPANVLGEKAADASSDQLAFFLESEMACLQQMEFQVL